jgi:hypothetical protein
MFFLAKKNQKTVVPSRVVVPKRRDSARKSFLLLFSKKAVLPFLLGAS